MGYPAPYRYYRVIAKEWTGAHSAVLRPTMAVMNWGLWGAEGKSSLSSLLLESVPSLFMAAAAAAPLLSSCASVSSCSSS